MVAVWLIFCYFCGSLAKCWGFFLSLAHIFITYKDVWLIIRNFCENVAFMVFNNGIYAEVWLVFCYFCENLAEF